MTIHLLDDTRLELNIAVFALGCLILIVGISRDLLNAKVPASAITVAMLIGILLGPHVLALVNTDKWNSEVLVQEVSRLVIAIQLMAIALNIPFHYLTKSWLTQGVLLTVVVALMWVTSGLIIYGFFRTIHNSFRFTFWESMLIGACVAPTDPVLASAVSTSALAISQVPARLRHTITAESGLNDGTGYPFVLLCLRFVRQGKDSAGKVIGDWVVEDILWEILLAIVIAIVVGFLVGKLLVFAEPAKLHDQQLLVALTVALAFAFVGGAQLIGINGLILVVVGGVVYARVVEGDKRGTESQLQETVDLIFSTLVFAIFGLIIPFDRWYLIGWWRGLLICLALALFRRVPWILLLKPIFKEQIHSIPDALFVGWFGPIGVGAIFYALFAAEYLDDDDRIWVVISMVVFSQVIIFGVTDTFFTRLYARTNPNYIRRRRRKQLVIERAETQIIHIQENVVYTLDSMPASPQLAPGESTAWDDLPEMELGHEYQGSPSAMELRMARDDVVASDVANGTELGEFGPRHSLDRHESRHESRSPRDHQVSFNLDADQEYYDNRNDDAGMMTNDNTILGTSNRLLGRALAQSHAGFSIQNPERPNQEPPATSRSEMRLSDLAAEHPASRVHQRRSSLPYPGSGQRKLSQSSYI